MDSGNAPYVSHATSFPSQLLSTFAFLPPSSISTLIKMLHTTMTPYHYPALPGYPLPKNKNQKKITYFQKISLLSKKRKKRKKEEKRNLLPNTPTGFWPRTHMHAHS